MAKGLLAILAPKGKGPGASPDEEMAPESAPEGSGSESAFAKEAFAALQDGDEEGFVSALTGMVKACVGSKGAY